MHYINKSFVAGRDEFRTSGSRQNDWRNADLDNTIR